MKNIINTALLLIAFILLVTVGTLSFVYSVIGLFFSVSVGRFSAVTAYLKEVAISIDVLGNELCSHVLNATLIQKKSVHKFGLHAETISSVLGKNEMMLTLTYAGGLLAKLLNLLEHNHCKNSITNYGNY